MQPLDADVVDAQLRTRSRRRSPRRPAARARPRRSPRASSTSPSANMANAIKQISVAARLRRHRATRLQCFGGAGGQHACRVADALGMTRVFIHPLAGVLSAYGMGLADADGDAPGGDRAAARRRARRGRRASRRARRRGRAPSSRARASAASRDRRRAPRPPALRRHRLGARRSASRDEAETAVAGFEAAYRQRFGFLMHERRLIVEAVSVEAVGAGDAVGRSGAGARRARGRHR